MRQGNESMVIRCLRIGMWIVICIMGIAVSACMPNIDATVTGSMPITATEGPVVAVATANHTPTADPLRFDTPTYQPPVGTPIAPVLAGWPENTIPDTEAWSPDGQWIGYRDRDDTTQIGLLNVVTRVVCPLGTAPPVSNIYDLSNMSGSHWSWLPDGRAVLIQESTGRAEAVTPCANDRDQTIMQPLQGSIQRIVSVSPDYRHWLVATAQGYRLYTADTDLAVQVDSEVNAPSLWGGAWSPGMTRLALSAHLTDPTTTTAPTVARTWVLDVRTGALVDKLDWQPVGAPGWHAEDPQPPSTWLDEERLVWERPGGEHGPLLWKVGEGETSIAADLLGMDCIQFNCMQLRVALANTDVTGSYHLILVTEDWPSGAQHLELYHSETGEAEPLDGWVRATFSPDGKTVNLFKDVDEGGKLVTSQAIRPLDPPGGEPQLSKAPVQWPSILSPDGRTSVVTEGSAIRAYSVPDGRLLGTWWVEGYRVGPIETSPDGRWLLVSGLDAQNSGALFLIELPNG